MDILGSLVESALERANELRVDPNHPITVIGWIDIQETGKPNRVLETQGSFTGDTQGELMQRFAEILQSRRVQAYAVIYPMFVYKEATGQLCGEAEYVMASDGYSALQARSTLTREGDRLKYSDWTREEAIPANDAGALATMMAHR